MSELTPASSGERSEKLLATPDYLAEMASIAIANKTHQLMVHVEGSSEMAGLVLRQPMGHDWGYATDETGALNKVIKDTKNIGGYVVVGSLDLNDPFVEAFAAMIVDDFEGARIDKGTPKEPPTPARSVRSNINYNTREDDPFGSVYK